MPDDQRPQFTSSPQQWRNLQQRALDMRHEPTAAEDTLWQRIRNRQIENAKFRRQHSVEGFVVDFVCIERILVIEVDGEIHEQSDQKAHDAERQAILESRGFCVVRFTNAEVLQSLETVAETIAKALNEQRP